jgi:hypothetical protein
LTLEVGTRAVRDAAVSGSNDRLPGERERSIISLQEQPHRTAKAAAQFHALGPVCTENLVRIDLMRESLNVGHDGRADISLRAGLYKDRANKANVKIGQRKCHITST